jgi:transcriptional antiterminator NusG
MDYKWYAIAVYSGSEMTAVNEIKKILKTDDNIKEVFFPTKKVFKISKGKKIEAVKKLFPNYVFVNMSYSRDTINKIRSLPRIMGFIGSDQTNPQVVSEDEIVKLKNDSEQAMVAEDDVLEVGDTIRIKEGHFESFSGVIEGKDEGKNLLKISITIFGRSTMIEIEPSKVEKI